MGRKVLLISCLLLMHISGHLHNTEAKSFLNLNPSYRTVTYIAISANKLGPWRGLIQQLRLHGKRRIRNDLPKIFHESGNNPNPHHTGDIYRKPIRPGLDLALLKPTRLDHTEFPYVESNFKNQLKQQSFNPTNAKKLFPSKRKVVKSALSEKSRKRIFTNLHLAPKRDAVKYRFYGRPAPPSNILGALEEYNKEHPLNTIHLDDLKCDLLYCHSNGTIAFIKEGALPHNNTISSEYYEKYNTTEEPRFIVQVSRGFVKQNNLMVGDELDALNAKNREEFFDNHFARPKCFREPLKLPNGRYIP